MTSLLRFLGFNSIVTGNIRHKISIDHVNFFVEECVIIETGVADG